MLDQDGNLDIIDKDKYCSWYQPEDFKEGLNWETEILYVDITGNVGSAKIRLECLGPATETDIVWWTGFNKTQTIRILQELENQVEKIQIKGIDKEYLILSEDLKKTSNN